MNNDRHWLSTFASWNIAVLVDLFLLVKVVIPTFKRCVLMSIGATIGAWLGYAIGGFDAALLWLFGFAVLDFITGNIAVIKAGKWQSNMAYRGIFKKMFIFIMVAICHGVDMSMGTDFVRTACVFAYILNEVGSILENIERMGFGDIIPSVLKDALDVAKKEKLRLGGKNNKEHE